MDQQWETTQANAVMKQQIDMLLEKLCERERNWLNYIHQQGLPLPMNDPLMARATGSELDRENTRRNTQSPSAGWEADTGRRVHRRPSHENSCEIRHSRFKSAGSAQASFSHLSDSMSSQVPSESEHGLRNSLEENSPDRIRKQQTFLVKRHDQSVVAKSKTENTGYESNSIDNFNKVNVSPLPCRNVKGSRSLKNKSFKQSSRVVQSTNMNSSDINHQSLNELDKTDLNSMNAQWLRDEHKQAHRVDKFGSVEHQTSPPTSNMAVADFDQGLLYDHSMEILAGSESVCSRNDTTITSQVASLDSQQKFAQGLCDEIPSMGGSALYQHLSCSSSFLHPSDIKSSKSLSPKHHDDRHRRHRRKLKKRNKQRRNDNSLNFPETMSDMKSVLHDSGVAEAGSSFDATHIDSSSRNISLKTNCETERHTGRVLSAYPRGKVHALVPSENSAFRIYYRKSEEKRSSNKTYVVRRRGSVQRKLISLHCRTNVVQNPNIGGSVAKSAHVLRSFSEIDPSTTSGFATVTEADDIVPGDGLSYGENREQNSDAESEDSNASGYCRSSRYSSEERPKGVPGKNISVCESLASTAVRGQETGECQRVGREKEKETERHKCEHVNNKRTEQQWKKRDRSLEKKCLYRWLDEQKQSLDQRRDKLNSPLEVKENLDILPKVLPENVISTGKRCPENDQNKNVFPTTLKEDLHVQKTASDPKSPLSRENSDRTIKCDPITGIKRRVLQVKSSDFGKTFVVGKSDREQKKLGFNHGTCTRGVSTIPCQIDRGHQCVNLHKDHVTLNQKLPVGAKPAPNHSSDNAQESKTTCIVLPEDESQLENSDAESIGSNISGYCAARRQSPRGNSKKGPRKTRGTHGSRGDHQLNSNDTRPEKFTTRNYHVSAESKESHLPFNQFTEKSADLPRKPSHKRKSSENPEDDRKLRKRNSSGPTNAISHRQYNCGDEANKSVCCGNNSGGKLNRLENTTDCEVNQGLRRVERRSKKKNCGEDPVVVESNPLSHLSNMEEVINGVDLWELDRLMPPNSLINSVSTVNVQSTTSGASSGSTNSYFGHPGHLGGVWKSIVNER